MGFAVINLAQGQDAIIQSVQELTVAIQETQMEQLSRILDAVEAHNAVQEAEKHAEARRQFLSQVLSKYVVPNAAYNDQGKRGAALAP